MLIDCETFNFRPSVVVAAILSGSIEVYLKINLQKQKLDLTKYPSYILKEIQISNTVWDHLLKFLFGP